MAAAVAELNNEVTWTLIDYLQLVVEMRTTELHRLREERWRHLQQLDQLEKTKDLLEKANARVEDLTVQLAAKTELERYAGNASFILLCNKLQNAAVWARVRYSIPLF